MSTDLVVTENTTTTLPPSETLTQTSPQDAIKTQVMILVQSLLESYIKKGKHKDIKNLIGLSIFSISLVSKAIKKIKGSKELSEEDIIDVVMECLKPIANRLHDDKLISQEIYEKLLKDMEMIDNNRKTIACVMQITGHMLTSSESLLDCMICKW